MSRALENAANSKKQDSNYTRTRQPTSATLTNATTSTTSAKSYSDPAKRLTNAGDLADLRIIQTNLVYVLGLPDSLAKEEVSLP
jgi:hypothetical protein